MACERSTLVRNTKYEYVYSLGKSGGPMRHVEAGGIGWRIARARKERGLTQEELAALIGVSARSIQGYEAGKVVPYRRLSQLAEATNRELGWILEGDAPAKATVTADVLERLVTLVEEFSEEARRIRVAAERLEHLLGGAPATSPAQRPTAPGSGARP
jgi:transcriptional regulator with XRE-family HTH domain